jgi:hypothetical protein
MQQTHTRRIARLFVAGATTFALLSSSAGVSFAAGGTGGAPFTLLCPDNKALVGIKGRAGSLVDEIAGVCKRFDDMGNGTGTVSTPEIGGTGGNSFELRCPSGEVVIGLQGGAGWWVDRVQLVCAPINATGGASGDGETDSFTAGGTGGTSFSLMCPAISGGHKPAVGLAVRVGTLVDNINLVCGQPAIDPIVPVVASRPDLRVAVRGLPFQAHNNTSVTYTVVMRNVGAPITGGVNAEVDLTTTSPLSFPMLNVPQWLQSDLSGCTVPNPPRITRCKLNSTWSGDDFSIQVLFPLTVAGTFGFSAIADPANVIAEGVGGGDNNTQTETLRVIP